MECAIRRRERDGMGSESGKGCSRSGMPSGDSGRAKNGWDGTIRVRKRTGVEGSRAAIEEIEEDL